MNGMLISMGTRLLVVYHCKRGMGHAVLDWLYDHEAPAKAMVHCLSMPPRTKKPAMQLVEGGRTLDFVCTNVEDPVRKLKFLRCPEGRSGSKGAVDWVQHYAEQYAYGRVSHLFMIRDALNNAASRIKTTDEYVGRGNPNPRHGWYDGFPNDWCSYVRQAEELAGQTEEISGIDHDYHLVQGWRWLDAGYRIRLSDDLGFASSPEGLRMRDFGDGSSFDRRSERDVSKLPLNDRWQQYVCQCGSPCCNNHDPRMRKVVDHPGVQSIMRRFGIWPETLMDSHEISGPTSLST